MALPALAQDGMLLQENSSALSGTVSEINGDTLTIINNGKPINVDIENMDLDAPVRDLIAPGNVITIEGEFRDSSSDTPVFEARNILRQGAALAPVLSQEWINGDNNRIKDDDDYDGVSNSQERFLKRHPPVINSGQ